jgi:hypothetical protein
VKCGKILLTLVIQHTINEPRSERRMLSMLRSIVALGTVVGTLAVMPMGAAGAAELQGPRAARPAYCGPCGCLQVTYVYHPAVLSTYGTGLDPRNADFTQPYYYPSRSVHAYPRYFVDGVPLPDQCPVE